MKRTRLLIALLSLSLGLSGVIGLASCANNASTPTDMIVIGARSISINETVQLDIMSNSKTKDDVAWSSSDAEVASVDSNGLVKGLKAGMVTITASDKNDASFSASVDIIVNEETVEEGHTVRFIDWDGDVLLTQQVENGEKASYTISNPERIADDERYYTFKGWSEDLDDPIYEDTDFIAEYRSTEWGDDWVFTLDTTSNSYYLSSCTVFATSITIPTSFNYRPVIGINSSCFYQNTNLAQVILHDGIIAIGNYAFYGCTSLVDVQGATSIRGMGNAAFYECRALESLTIGGSLASIPANCFYGCDSLASISLPSTVQAVYEYAFCGCSKLESISLPNCQSVGDYAFDLCSSLKSYEMSKYLYEIGDLAFAYCDLQEIVIPAYMQSLGTYCFVGNPDISKITVETATDGWGIYYTDGYGLYENDYELVYSGSTVTGTTITKEAANLLMVTPAATKDDYSINANCHTVSGWAFYGSNIKNLTIPSSVNRFGYGVFYNVKSLTTVNWLSPEENAPDIDISGVFEGCSGLTSVTLPAGLTAIGAGAFGDCTSLSSIEIPSKVASIGDYAFRGTAISSINMPSGLTSLGGWAFYGCSNLASIDLSRVTRIGTQAFYNDAKLATVTWPTTLTYLGGAAFQGCTSLTAVSLPSLPESSSTGEVTLPYRSFAGCTGITSFVVPDGVTLIDNYAFSGMNGLISIVLPASLKTINKCAFGNCTAITTINFKGSEAEWSAITIDETVEEGAGSNAILKTLTPTYNYAG